MIVEHPTLGDLEFPDDTPPETIKAAIRKAEGGAQMQQPAPEQQESMQREVATGRGRAAKLSQERQEQFDAQLRAQIPEFQGDPAQLEEIGAAPELNEFSKRALKASLSANLIGSDYELAQALKAQFPEATFARDRDANLIATMPSGSSYYLNAPGFSGQDVVKFATRLAAFTPAGRGSAGLTALAGKTAATEGVLQGAEAGVGGDFNPADIGVAAVAAPAGQAIGNKITSAVQGRAADRLLAQAAPTPESLKSQAGAIYQQLDDLGVTIPQPRVQALSQRILNTIKGEGFNQRIHPKVAGVLDEVEAVAGQPMTTSQVDTLRKVAQGAARSLEPDEARLGSMIIGQIDDFLEELPEQAVSGGNANVGGLFRQARGMWSQARKSEMLQQAFEKARNQASGFENGIRVQFRSLLNNPRKMRGFSEAEKDAIKQVVRGGSAENIMKAMGKFGFSEGQATNMLLGSLGIAGGAAVGGPGGAAAVPIVGQTARMAAQKLTARNAKLADLVVRAGNDGKRIALEYVRNVPKNQRSTEELAGLLAQKGVDLSGLKSNTNPLVSNAALAASLILNAKPEVEGPEE